MTEHSISRRLASMMSSNRRRAATQQGLNPSTVAPTSSPHHRVTMSSMTVSSSEANNRSHHSVIKWFNKTECLSMTGYLKPEDPKRSIYIYCGNNSCLREWSPLRATDSATPTDINDNICTDVAKCKRNTMQSIFTNKNQKNIVNKIYGEYYIRIYSSIPSMWSPCVDSTNIFTEDRRPSAEPSSVTVVLMALNYVYRLHSQSIRVKP